MTISKEELAQIAQEVINKEATSIARLAGFIDSQFIDILHLIFNSKGRLIVTGIGKSAIIANKVVATLNSTGTPAIFMHAADAIHGDLGIIQKDDIVLCLSKSGNTAEIKVLVPWIKKMGNKIIGMVSDTNSFLAKNSDYLIRATVDSEACPNNLAPTSSTTAQLVMGDALAVCLLKMRGFSQEDFAKVHPGGSLGKKLYTRVSDLIDRSVKPMVREDDSIQNTILNISANRLGATVVLHENGEIAGIITDGDVRRMVEKGIDIQTLRASDIMSPNPKKIDAEELAVKAFNMMEQNKITSLVVIEKGKYIGLVHIHDILREGIV
ncbi:MAG TPA: KpsF/GutQ family sugar-phosphate isomerase [Bacteroidales bacterium]|jgi:arabinose-5-phosphate isomerase|nr:KpsF/GutQ family sugar-phosphate isomerase [Bacteroidales bacterium]HON54149.1 KpsF/GutQ family sugar-phosphate isomerase [Bacteroidales bacterium]HRR49016.1 KpsF/GutQ family sugar-phosphate isomerase [Bacteroidales bacterium]HRT32964.1 KpsF/GutQ family sugar-phosphate isomerase [Bacteroidales bacterium]HRT83312.1 KpsF/GutQ family sugar-phosphate isomerase [Bacteroidales bacterium]